MIRAYDTLEEAERSAAISNGDHDRRQDARRDERARKEVVREAERIVREAERIVRGAAPREARHCNGCGQPVRPGRECPECGYMG